jgi:cell division protease FtsH
MINIIITFVCFVPQPNLNFYSKISNKRISMIDYDYWSYTRLLKESKLHHVKNVVVSGVNVIGETTSETFFKTDIVPYQIPAIVENLTNNDVDLSMKTSDGDSIFNIVGNLLPWIAIAGAYTFLTNRQNNIMSGNLMASKETNMIEDVPTTKFTDIAGCEESKFELQEIVDFLKDPEKYKTVGAKIPKGVIMEGPPGTGKTLLARAVAAEAQVPFISISASQFVEMYVGLGAARVRNLFKQAKENTPSIIFIDEIDAIGKKRSTGQGGMSGNEEREQTLNQILSEMDGFEKDNGVIVMAATNRIDMLDDALLRPGRFDRKVSVSLPNLNERIEILKVHSRDKPIDEYVKFKDISKEITGFSGAQIANLLNEASIQAARKNQTKIYSNDIEDCIDKITLGFEKPNTIYSEKQKKLIAYHEAGHALVGFLNKDFDETVSKVTIIPRSNGAGGFTKFLPSDESLNGLQSQKYLKAKLSVILGGRCAEKIVFGDNCVTTGASSDIKVASELSYTMIKSLGFGSTRIIRNDEDISDEAKKLVDDAEKIATDILLKNRDLMDRFVDILISKETIVRNDINFLYDNFYKTI